MLVGEILINEDILQGELLQSTITIPYVDYDAENLAYVKQQDLMADINSLAKYNESEYTKEEINRIEKLLKNMTEGA